jgi:3-methyladenine DNA glycosylase/8-oxoguanine DNA glycosylase
MIPIFIYAGARAADGHFGALVRGIVYQQLGWRAAQAICARLRIAAGNTFTPEAISALSDDSRIGLART